MRQERRDRVERVGLYASMTHVKKRHRAMLIGLMLAACEALFLRRRQGKLLGTNIIVRCREGHLFNTIWIPGASIKSIRLGPWRIQRCPVGAHWTVVTPVKLAELTDDERRTALSRRDVRLP
jgi:hypothetical protein